MGQTSLKKGPFRDWGTAKADLPQLRADLYGGVYDGAEENKKEEADPLLGAGVVKGSMVPTRSDPRLARAPPPSRKGITNFNNAKISKKSKSLLS